MKLETVIAKRPNKTIYRDGDKAIKVFAEDFSKADILNEALNTARIEETGLNVNKIREVAVVDGKWAISTDFIEGTTLAEMMDKNPEKIDEYIEMFVDIQMDIHSKKAPMLNKHTDKMQAKISKSGLDATTRYELHTRLDGMKKHTKVLHGDFNPSNVIIKADGSVFIIDWAHATQGNASGDVARSYLLFKLAGKDEIAEKYLNTFCKKSDTPKQYVQQWLPIVAASQLVKGKPEEKEFLSAWASVCEYE